MTNSPPETISATPISFESGTMGSSCWPFSVRHVNICNASVEISLTFDYNSKLVSDECSVFHRYLTGLSFILKISPALFKINIVKCTAGLNKIIAFRLVVAKVLSNVPPPTSGLPVQLDRVLPVLLSDQYHRRALRSHLWLRPLPDQMDSYRQSTYTCYCFSNRASTKLREFAWFEHFLFSRLGVCLNWEYTNWKLHNCNIVWCFSAPPRKETN